MRKSCLECVAKHLGSAAVFIKEYNMGYPAYYGYVYGELDHAAAESFRDFTKLSQAIREHRLKWAETRDDPAPHNIPFEAMFAFIDDMKEADMQLEIPNEVMAGLETDKNGNLVISMDTRPADGEAFWEAPQNGEHDEHAPRDAMGEVIPSWMHPNDHALDL